MPAQINLPVIDRDGLENVVRGFEKIRLADIDVARLGQFDLFEIIRPIQIRRERLQLRLLHLVIIFLRIAQCHPRARGLGQRHFHGHDFCRALRGQLGRVAEEREHFRHVLDVLVADFFRTRVFLCVIIAVGQSEPALESLRDHHRAVLRVLVRAETEERGHADGVQMRDLFQDIAAILQCVDPFEFIGKRRHTRAVYRFFIHPARVKVANLLQIDLSRLLGIRFRGNFWRDRRRLLHDLVQRVVILFGQHIEAAPTRELWRDRVVLYPAAVGIKIEIVLRLDGRIHIFRIERRRYLIRGRFFFRRFGRRRCLRVRAERANKSRCGKQ